MKKFFLTIILQGGLGNQLFQFATAYALAIKNNLALKINIRRYNNFKDRKFELYKFPNVKKVVFIDNSRLKVLFLLITKKLLTIFTFYKKKNFESSPFIFNKDLYNRNFNRNTSLIGYFQSEKYFVSEKKKIVNLFKFPLNKKNQVNLYLNKIKNSNSVAIHFRGGDYITNLDARNFHGNLSKDYYIKSVKFITNKIQNPHFFVFSDDDNFIIKISLIKNLKYSYVNIQSAFDSLYLMSQCQHHIIANSSFSWWGAWLSKNNNKIVCAPKKWVKVNIKTEDVIPSSWIKF
jgi:hypothetical protein